MNPISAKDVRARRCAVAMLSALLGLSGQHRAEAGTNVWTAIGPEGRVIYRLAIDPNAQGTIYASSDPGLFKTTDAGATWAASGPGTRTVVLDPTSSSTLYTAAPGGVFKSTDGGASWSGTGMTNPRVALIAIDPRTHTTLYAGTRLDFEIRKESISKSIDGGDSWTALNSGPSWVDIYGLAIDSETPSTVYAGAFGSGVFKTTDGGATWSYANVGLTNHGILALAIDPQTPATLYVGTIGGPGYASGGVFKSTDGGATWAATGLPNITINALAIDPKAPTTLYAAAYSDGVFKSIDGGDHWIDLSAGLSGVNVTTLAVDPQDPRNLYAGTNGAGVFALRQEEAPPNHPPLADAGPDQVVEATGPDGALVTLDGSGSSDPDGDALAYDWSWAAGRADGDHPRVTLPLGTTTVTLLVSDPQKASATDSVLITIQDTTAPAIAMSAPDDGATVSGTMNITASASDAVAVSGVQFLIDGMPLGPEDTWAPYEVPWDTRSASDGVHHLAARARDAAGNLATSAALTVTVANGPVPALAVVRTEETGVELEPAGTWTVISNEDVGVAMSGSRAVYAGSAGSTATFTFTGTGVRWIGFPCERCGIADVLIDGRRTATVDTFDPSRPEFSRVMYTSPRLEVGSHTLVIMVTGVANTSSVGPFVVVDAFDVMLDETGLLPPLPPPAPIGLPGGFP